MSPNSYTHRTSLLVIGVSLLLALEAHRAHAWAIGSQLDNYRCTTSSFASCSGSRSAADRLRLMPLAGHQACCEVPSRTSRVPG